MKKSDVAAGIRVLIEKYEKAKQEGKLKSYTEQETKNGFISPLFRLLGWDIDNRDEMTSEENITGKRVDYGFYLSGRPRFYVEAKKFSVDLNNPDFANQAVRYAWNKGVAWAVLTDFQSIKIFNAQDIKRSLADKLFKSIGYTEYLSRLDELSLLSKDAIAEDLLDKEAARVGKIYQRVPVSDMLYKDLDECRDILTESLLRCNPQLKKDPDLLDEGVQKLLDRLIFLRVAEDRGVEPNILRVLLREAEANRKGNMSLYQAMAEKFRELDITYNSNLFSEHTFEGWDEFSGATEKVIDKLYGKKGYYEYDFKVMPADVLGTVYEHYLAHRLSKSRKGITLDKDAKKRKEQGIYYTPSFVVDYIVKHALQPVLDKCETMDDVHRVKVLDPACGSGSFLIKALEVLSAKYKELGAPDDERTKFIILTRNLYGVDLDEKAVEIARLNLLINSLTGKAKLPPLDQNIKCGNSLISGSDEELKRSFGKDWREKKRFNWQEEFPEVFAQGGFDVIIGNPPYIDSEEMAKSQPDFRDYCVEKYAVAKGNWDLFCIFIERGISILKKGGILGMIVPNKLISAKYALATRNLLISNSVLALADYSNIAVFGANVYPIVVIAGKGKDENHKLEITVNHGIDFPAFSSMRIFPRNILTKHEDGWAPLFEERKELDFLDRIIRKLPKLEEIKSFRVVGAATVGEAYEIKKIIKEATSGQNDDFRFINTGTIDRYCSLWGIKSTRYIKNSYNEPSLSKSEFRKIYPKRYEQASSPKIIIGGMSKFLECFLDKDGEYIPGKSTTIILGERSDSLKILLSILNSRLMSGIYARIFKSLSLAGGFFRIGTPQIKLLPISFPEGKEAKNLVNMADKMLMLNAEFAETTENSTKWESLKSEIERTDRKIDQEVYKLYGLTEEEIKIVESPAA